MKPARIAVLGIAVVAGLGAAFVASGSKPPEAPPAPPPPVLTDDVLVVNKELNSGDVIDESGLRWEPWPKDRIPEGFIRKSVAPASIGELKGSYACANFSPGDPLRRERLVKDPHCGFLAARLRPGRRAVAINIDTQGSSTAGGFILPNNRVDVISITQDDNAARKGINGSFISQTILKNIRVLAIGQNIQEKNGERVITGATATLELSPDQAEIITLAQRIGQLSLSLRSTAEANNSEEPRQSHNDQSHDSQGHDNQSHDKGPSKPSVRKGVAMRDGPR